MAKDKKHAETDEELLQRTIAARKTAELQERRDAMAAALLELRHASAEATPPHNRSLRWQQALAKADEILANHYTPETQE